MLLALGMKGFDMLVENFTSSNSTSTNSTSTDFTTFTASSVDETTFTLSSVDETTFTASSVDETTFTLSSVDETTFTEIEADLTTTTGEVLEQAYFEPLVGQTSSYITTTSDVIISTLTETLASDVTISTLTETLASESEMQTVVTESETTIFKSRSLIETVSSEITSTMSSSSGSTILDILVDTTEPVRKASSTTLKMTTTDIAESETAVMFSTAPSSLRTSFFDESHLNPIIAAVSISTLVLITLGVIVFLSYRYRKRLGCCDEYHYYKCWYLVCPCQVTTSE